MASCTIRCCISQRSAGAAVCQVEGILTDAIEVRRRWRLPVRRSSSLSQQSCRCPRPSAHLSDTFNVKAVSTAREQNEVDVRESVWEAEWEREAARDAGANGTSELESTVWAIARELEDAGDARSRLGLLMRWAGDLPTPPPGRNSGSDNGSGSGGEGSSDNDSVSDSNSIRSSGNRVMGCTAPVWLRPTLLPAAAAAAASSQSSTESADPSVASGWLVDLHADSDSALMRGLCSLLRQIAAGRPAAQVLSLTPSSAAVTALSQALSPAMPKPSTPSSSTSSTSSISASTFLTLLLSLQKRLRSLLSPSPIPSLPSLLISCDGSLSAQGSFALQQAQFLHPSAADVSQLVETLSAHAVGVVAHFYMDAQLQGCLFAARSAGYPHIAISDSLVMADRALAMAQAGCRAVAVLGVDFMAENVRCVLAQGGYAHIPVVRMSSAPIGCSLADAARSKQYLTFLEAAAATPRSLHVVYINTALDSKALAHRMVPTITCTSSNVLQTVLQAFAQVPDLTLWYGPDTYMGANLQEMIRQLSTLPDEEVRKLHPQHTAASLRAMLPRVNYFQDGKCIVHDMFDHEVVRSLRQHYSDAFLTAHFEVPGEMFALAMSARTRGRGVVGSTQNILDFINARTAAAVQRGAPDRLQFVLGTESGMVTSIVRAVQAQLREAHAEGRGDGVEVEIVFPVDSNAVAVQEGAVEGGEGMSGSSSSSSSLSPSSSQLLPVVPGVQAGEGCSVAGGCASCPYMKMNSLSALLHVCSLLSLPDAGQRVAGFEPDAFEEEVGGSSVAAQGYVPILHMRHFQKNGVLPKELVDDILSR